MEKYYFICYSFSVGMGNPNSTLENLVIDYSPFQWLKAMNNKEMSYKHYTLISYNEITREEYLEIRDFVD